MGKKRIITESGVENLKEGNASASSKKKLAAGLVHIQATYNNTRLLLTDLAGNAILGSSSGALGFKGSKKGTPFAAGKVAEWLMDRAEALGLKEADVIIRGVGPGRESAVRVLVARGLVLNSIKDATPVPHNGPKPPKPRRV
jgi:small subunit ribosomal protein S11